MSARKRKQNASEPAVAAEPAAAGASAPSSSGRPSQRARHSHADDSAGSAANSPSGAFIRASCPAALLDSDSLSVVLSFLSAEDFLDAIRVSPTGAQPD
jgi:hypothetical protein